MFWEVKALGINSDDFARSRSDEASGQFYGQFWKFKDDRTNQDKLKQVQTEAANKIDKTEEKIIVGQNLDNFLVDEAKAKGLMPDHHNVSDPANDPAGDQVNIHQEPEKLTASALSRMNVAQLKDIASSVGVVNLEAKKADLIQAIMEKT